jgi:hypothetical protein
VQLITSCEHLELSNDELQKIGNDFVRSYHEGQFYLVQRACVRCFTIQFLSCDPDDPRVDEVSEAYVASQRASAAPE